MDGRLVGKLDGSNPYSIHTPTTWSQHLPYNYDDDINIPTTTHIPKQYKLTNKTSFYTNIIKSQSISQVTTSDTSSVYRKFEPKRGNLRKIGDKMYTAQPKGKGGDKGVRESADQMYTVSTQTQAKAVGKRESSGAYENKSDSIHKPLNTTTTAADSDDDNDDGEVDDIGSDVEEGQNYDPPPTTIINTVEAKAARRALIISTVAESRRTKSTTSKPSKTTPLGQKGQNYDSSYFHRSKQLKDYVINLKQTIQRSNGAIFSRRNEDFIATQELYPIADVSSTTNNTAKNKSIAGSNNNISK